MVRLVFQGFFVNALLTSAAAVLLIFTMPAAAGEDKSSSVTPRRVAHCMVERMKASPRESYRDAYKECKTRFETMQREGMPESPVNGVHTSPLAKP